MTQVALLVATVAGTGYAPVAPGTFGSAAGIVLILLTRTWPASWQLALVGGVIAVGVWASGRAAGQFGGEDPGHVVIDEVAGQLVTVLLLDLSIVGLVTAFFVFRLLDIVKPWPAGRFESLPGGWGVMADDLMAGAYGWVLMWVLAWWLPGVF
jgi:phosphatidylglycerophosphatase A